MWRKRTDYILLLRETEDKRSEGKIRRARLLELPLHNAFYNYNEKDLYDDINIEILQSLIEKNIDTMNELDYDNMCAFDIALQRNFHPAVLTTMLMMNLPFKVDDNGDIQEVDPKQHHYAWIKIVGPTDKYSELIRYVFKAKPRLIEKLVYACDDLGRPAIEVFNIISKDIFILCRLREGHYVNR